ncbi:hypothetical protein [Faecalibacterium prausnitzii]|uniref:hypothetical protein n=1 Tax=Faecalibacterium prausnitzii TaxID=853 RepID=UPI0011C1CD13
MLPDVDMGIIHAGQPEVGEGKGAARLTLRRSELEVFSEKIPLNGGSALFSMRWRTPTCGVQRTRLCTNWKLSCWTMQAIW